MKHAEYDEDATWNEPTEWDESWQAYAWENEEYEAATGQEGRGKRSKPNEKSKGKSTPRSITPRPAQNQNARPDRPQPKPKPEARSHVPDGYLFAMMTTQIKPTWRHTTWDSRRYMVCALDEPQRKLPAFEPGKWNVNHHRKIALFGHDDKNMKQFTLHFQSIAQNDTLDRAWFGGLAKYGFQWKRMSGRQAMLSRRTTSLTLEN